jgi:large subunit ribosomal protein L5
MESQKQKKGKGDNPNRTIFVEKITLSMGTNVSPELLEKALLLLEKISGKKPIKTISNKRIPTWSVRPGLPVGAMVTLRKALAEEKLSALLKALDNKLSKKSFDKLGNFSFGIKEYIDIPSIEYDHGLGILGLQVSVTLSRPGYRVKKRKDFKAKIGPKHLITKDEAIAFIKNKFGVEVE